MKLHSPRFEKELRRQVKKAVRSSPELKKEYRRVKKAARRRGNIHWLFAVVLPGITGFVVWGFAKGTGHPVTGLAVINLLTLFLAAYYAYRLPMFLFRATDLPALSLLPLPESEVFRWELQKFFRKSAVFSLMAMLSVYGGLGAYMGFSLVQWFAAFTLAVISWVTLLALAAFFAARFPRLPYPVFTGVGCVFAFGLFFTWKAIGSVVLHFIDQIAPALNLILPTGWCPSLFQLLLPGGQWIFALLIIPVALIIWTLKNSLELLESRLMFREHVRPEIPNQVPGREPNDSKPMDGAAGQSPARLGPTAIEEIVLTRQFLRHDPWARRGWIEKQLWRWLDARERTLVEFAFPTGVSITRPWMVLLRNFSVMLLAGFLAGLADVTFELWIVGIGLMITLVHALSLIWGNGSCFRAVLSSGIQMHLYAAYPITFRELSRMLFKVAAIQLPFFVVYALVCAVLLSYLNWTPFGLGMVAGVKLAFLIFSARFITTTLAFSTCTNDSTQFRLRTIVLVVSFVGSALLFLAMGAGSLFAPNPYLAWILWVAAIADAYGLSRIYGWFHNANQFDLMNVRR